MGGGGPGEVFHYRIPKVGGGPRYRRANKGQGRRAEAQREQREIP